MFNMYSSGEDLILWKKSVHYRLQNSPM